jgi:DNA-binding SARP family transcriptional activator
VSGSRTEGLRVRLLGAFEVDGIDTAAIRSRKARTLLRVLALARGTAVPPARLVDILWPQDHPSDPAAQLAVLVSRLRSTVGAERVTRTDAGYVLDVAWDDVAAALDFVEEGERRLEAGAASGAQAAAEAALRLLRGPLLADEADSDWAAAEGASVERLLARARHLLGTAALECGSVGAAVAAAEAALDDDPLDEEAVRLLMGAHSAMGRKATALAVFESFRARLADELGVDPAPATTAAHLAVLQDKEAPGLAVGPEPARPVSRVPLQGQGENGAALVGRGSELDALAGALRHVAATRRARLVVVEGEAGIGKTRLVEEWTRGLPALGATVLTGRSDELARVLPFQPVLDAVEDRLAALGSQAAAEVLGGDAALFSSVLGLSGPLAGPALPLSAGTGARGLVATAVLRVLTRLSEGITVLIVEDVHGADPATLDLLLLLHRRPPPVPLLVLATRRLEEGRAIEASLTLRLQPLDLESVAALVGPAEAAERHARSGGNPLLLFELDPGGGASSGLRESVSVRCERLGEAATTLRAAAVLGPALDLDILAAILGLRPVGLLDDLEEAVRRGFLLERNGAFAFRHELVREAVVSGVGAARRALLHREAARLLRGRAPEDPVAIAHHARNGGDLALASCMLVSAARIAACRGDDAQALALLADAESLDDTAAVHLERARVLLLVSRNVEGDAEARRALALGGGAAALEVMAAARYHLRDLGEALRLATEAGIRAEDGVVRAGALLLAARSLHALGDVAAAEERFEEAAAAARPGASARGIWLGFLRVHQGRSEEGLRLVEAAAASSDLAINLFAPGHLHFVAGYALACMGRVEEAMQRFDHLDAVCDELGVVHFVGRSENFRGWMLRNLGELDAADEHTLRAIESGHAAGTAEVQAQGWLDLADGALQRGDVDSARRHLDAARALADSPHAFLWRHRMRRGLLEAKASLLSGDPDEALSSFAQLHAAASAGGIERYAVRARLLALLARLAGGAAADIELVGADLAALRSVAGLDGWQLAADLAAATGSQTCAGVARDMVAHIAVHAGARRPAFEAYAARRLDGAGSRGV